MFKYHNDLICYNQTKIAHDADNLFILDKHSTNEGTWSLLQVTGGEINVVFVDGEDRALSSHYLNATTAPIIIPPMAWHKIEPVSESFYAELEFYCKPHRYFSKKHHLGNVHSDLLYVYQAYLQGQGAQDVLDVGSGTGRNALYLSLLGHKVHAIDIKEPLLRQMNHIAHQEKLDDLTATIHDLNKPLSLPEASFDFVVSTVCLQFLNPARIPALLQELQASTRAQGIHFLVYPIQSEHFSLPQSFTYLSEPDELLHLYQDSGWSILEYKESIGQLHRLDEMGRPIQGLFALLLAQKT